MSSRLSKLVELAYRAAGMSNILVGHSIPDFLKGFCSYTWHIFVGTISPLAPICSGGAADGRPAGIKTQLDILHTKVVFVSSIIICYSINTTTVLDTLSVSSHKNVVTVSKTH